MMKSNTCPMCRRRVNAMQVFQFSWRDDVRESLELFVDAAALSTLLCSQALLNTLNYGWRAALTHDVLFFAEALLDKAFPQLFDRSNKARHLLTCVVAQMSRQVLTGILCGGRLSEAPWTVLAFNCFVWQCIGTCCGRILARSANRTNEAKERHEVWTVCTPNRRQLSLFTTGVLMPFAAFGVAKFWFQ